MKIFQTIHARLGIPAKVPTDAQFIDFEFGDHQVEVKIITHTAVDAKLTDKTFLIYKTTDGASVPDGFEFCMMKEGVALFIR